jgi:hypothetical protein
MKLIKNTFLFIALFSISIGLSAQTNGTLTFSATTVNQFGTYQPNNIMAIWITTSTGAFVKTLKKEASQRVQYLYKWKANSSSNVTDAIVGATLSSHQTHTVNWNCKNVSQVVVPDADYKVWIEFTDGDYQGIYTSFTWTKGPASQILNPTHAALTNVSIQWTPNGAGVEEDAVSKKITVYPNPFCNELNFVIENTNGNCLVDIYDVVGKKVSHLEKTLNSSIKNILTWNGLSENGAHLNNGIYFYSVSIGANKYSGKVILSK